MKTLEQIQKKREYNRRYNIRYKKKNIERIRLRDSEYTKNRRKLPKFKKQHNDYMKEYSKREYVRLKQNIRIKTQRIYGEVPKGYERHHLNYDSPHNFILLPIKEHKILHHKLK